MFYIVKTLFYKMYFNRYSIYFNRYLYSNITDVPRRKSTKMIKGYLLY